MSPNPARRLVVLGLPLALLLLGAAQEPAPMSPHEKAARELVRLVGAERLAREGVESMMTMMGDYPETADYKDIIRDWYQKNFPAADLEAEMVRLYMDRFSEKELREIAAFYKTPTGRKAIDALPELMRQSATFGIQKVQVQTEELQAMIDKAREERENQPAATNAEAQKRTVSQIRNTGTAMFSWLTDQVGAAAAGQSQMPDEKRVSLDRYPPLSRAELQEILVPQYIQTVPERDGWGNPYEYFLNVEDPLAPNVMTIRSAGKDGRFQGIEYTVTSFDPDDLDQDIVWSDGFFVRWPERKPEQ
ncbi:MAG TPA: DUF2059 domain-containing protein [Thermoanaerobaculia bacterium]|nr:DUF2059 domain-containing protein [Thermoanaerobaculia bacterium]